MTTRKKVGIQLPKQAQNQTLEERWSLELEALAPIADIVEIRADTPAEFAEGVKDMDAIITSWGLRIDQQVIESLGKAVCIGVGSVGVDMVDINAATEAGLVVTNVPDVFIEEVADHAMGLLLDLARRTPTMVRMAKDGDWYQARPLLSKIPRLFGQTLGLYGFGNVSHCTTRRAKAFGMHIIAYDPYVSELEITKEGVEPVGFQEMLERSDYVSVHAPHNEETHHAFSSEAFRHMKETGVIVNTARGPIIDEVALIEALQSGQIAGAGLDVLEQEPPEADNPLLTMENVVVTPHVASATTRMRPETRRRVGREVSLVLRGKWPMSCVNPTVLPKVTLERWQPYPMNRGPNR
ncbi:MAG: C-terminal binding protein [Pseudomonadales bacterium]|jgi:D-3-phosphoglycerate dehydrogenase / 2-oxoglutarate reductase|nr:C-terminal binding protein [Pseudomonadales bacterium]